MSTLQDVLDEIKSAEVKTLPISQKKVYVYHGNLYKDAVDEAAAELARLQAIEAAAQTADGWKSYAETGGGCRDAFKGLYEALKDALARKP